MNSHSCEKQILRSFGCTKTHIDQDEPNEPKQSKANHNKQQFKTNFALPCPQPGRF